MPYADPEKKKASDRAYYWAHKAEINERARLWRADPANREAQRYNGRTWAKMKYDSDPIYYGKALLAHRRWARRAADQRDAALVKETLDGIA